jgi:CRP/FNR family transcriptional regulator, cyclic AMP receptor protein
MLPAVDVPLLTGLPDDERRATLVAGRRRRFGRREVVFHEGDPGDTMHVVLAGHVGLRITTPLGDVAMVRVVGAGGFFGELALITPDPRSATALALEPSETWSLHRDHFTGLVRGAPSVQEALMSALAAEIRRLAGVVVEAMYLPAEKRVWRRLIELADSYGAGDGGVPLTQDEVAQLAGVTRPTANRLLRRAVDAGALHLTRGRIHFDDVTWLARQAR